jgi:hypothetical protein
MNIVMMLTLANETHKKWVKSQYDKYVQPRAFMEGDLVLVYDQDHDTLGVGKFEPLWHNPYILNASCTKGPTS